MQIRDDLLKQLDEAKVDLVKAKLEEKASENVYTLALRVYSSKLQETHKFELLVERLRSNLDLVNLLRDEEEEHEQTEDTGRETEGRPQNLFIKDSL